MRNKLKFILLASISALSFLSLAVGTIAWFGNSFTFADINDKIKGDSAAAYFAYGNGTEAKPYGIRTARQLYNLAWLQYNGTFNKDEDEDGVIDKQYYFEIDPNIDEINMNGWTLPPIGTEQNPFIGSFNGNGKTVKSLTVSNKTDLTKPNAINYTVQPKIVGFFGAVGNPNLANLDYTFDSSIISLKNVTLEDITIESKTKQTLVGLAAGYVEGDISGVKVNGDAEIDINDQQHTALGGKFANLTDYALVGYTTKLGNAGTFQQKLSSYYHAGGAGGGGSDAGEGGSINSAFYMNWLFNGPRDSSASLTKGDSKNENHITKSNQYEVHYTVSNEYINPSDSCMFYVYYNANNFFGFNGNKKGYYKKNSNKYAFSWDYNSNGVKHTDSCNFALTFDSNITFGSRTAKTFWLNHLNSSSITTNMYIYSSASGSGNSYLVSTNYTLTNNIVYRVKDNYNSSSGNVHSSYMPLKFTDTSLSSVHSNNTGYIVGTSLTTTDGKISANGSPKVGLYGTNYVTNSLGTASSYTSAQIVYQGYGNYLFNDAQTEILTYSTADNDWVGIKDTHNSTYYGSATKPKNANLNNKVTKLRTPEQLGLKKYEPYDSDPSITETAERPLTRTSLKNIFTYKDGETTKYYNQISGIHFDSVTTNSGTVYGKVSNSNKITIPKAYLNGLDSAHSSNYELLKGAINFKFPNKGFVNFLAGTYNSDSTKKCDFFSIFKVKRNASQPNKIDAIYEIVGVYDNSASDYYAYKVFAIDSNGNQTGNAFYIDENNNTISNTNTLSLKFDVQKSLKCDGSSCPVENTLYYFEIPINPGDYAMGVTTGSTKTGAYMLYLDIGANAEIKDEVSAYAITTITSGNKFPDGVDFAPVSVTGNGGETIGVYIASEKQGIITFVVSSDNSKISINGTSNLSTYAFQGSKYSQSSPPSGNFIVDGNAPPGAMATLSSGGTRVLTITLKPKGSSTSTDIRIVDTLTDNAGTIDESKTVVQIDNGSGYTTSTIANVNGLLANAGVNVSNGGENSIRNLTNVVTLTRTGTVKNEFVTTYDTANCTADTVAVNIVTNGTTISIGVTTGSFTIGGVAYTDGSTYSES